MDYKDVRFLDLALNNALNAIETYYELLFAVEHFCRENDIPLNEDIEELLTVLNKEH